MDMLHQMPIEPFNDAQLQELAAQIAASVVAQRNGRSPWDRRLSLGAGALAIISIVFTAGLTWSRIETVERMQTQIGNRFDDLERSQHDLERAQSGTVGDTRVINEKLDQIQREVSEIKGRLGPR